MEIEEMNVYQRLAEVRKSVSYLKKEQDGQQYKYVGSSDVLGALHSKINECGLLLIPAIVNHKVTEHVENVTQQNKYTKQTEQKLRITYFTELEMKMRWQNIDDHNDYIEMPWYAQGVDIAGEKGVGKALTYGEKYFLLKFFNIATDKDDPDAFQKKQESKKPPKTINGKQLAELNDFARQVAEVSGLTPDVFTQKIAEMGKVRSISELLETDFLAAKAELVKWKQSYRAKVEQQNTNKSINWGQ